MTEGMPRLAAPGKGKTASEAVAGGEAPSVPEAERTLKRLRREARVEGRSVMVEEAEPEGSSDTETVKKAAARKLASAKEARHGAEDADAKAASGAGAS
jgi:hypothetical protein